MGVKDYSYLIIGGTTKAATTSLFFYLKDHPQVCAANMKEVRFFLDKDYPLPSRYRHEDGIEKYNKFFSHCNDDTKMRLESTPDYLYSKGTPHKIKGFLPNIKLVFILREPVSRLVSWFRFAKQNGSIPVNTTFEKYIDLNKQENNDKQHLLALEQGMYSIYLRPYFELFGHDKICIAFYENIASDPASAIKEICIFAGIDPGFYKGYDFQILNRTETMKTPKIHNLYKKLRFHISSYTHDKPFIHSFLKRMRLAFEPIYFSLNIQTSDNPVAVSSGMKSFLMDYYKTEPHALEELIGKNVPWKIGGNF